MWLACLSLFGLVVVLGKTMRHGARANLAWIFHCRVIVDAEQKLPVQQRRSIIHRTRFNDRVSKGWLASCILQQQIELPLVGQEAYWLRHVCIQQN